MSQIHKIIVKGKEIDKIYRVQGITKKEAIILAQNLFCDPITQTYEIDKNTKGIEIAYKPGVMNPEVASIIKAAKDLKINLLAADSSLVYKNKKKQDLEINNITQHFVTKDPKTLLITSQPGITNIVPIRKLTDDQLMNLSHDKLFLNLAEMKIIQDYFNKIKRDPTDCELEIIAGRWSEHCGHKTFKAKVIVDGVEKLPLFTRIQKTAKKYFKDNIISAFEDNSGVMKFYDGLAICGKVETHNSPSAIEPYGGAMTGSGGVFRDPLGTGQGAKLIISNDMFCFAPVDINPKLLPEGTLSPDYLQRKVVEGVRDYGNRMGIPTNNGSVHYHKDFRCKPTILVGAYGIMPENKAKKCTPKKGDFVVIVGGKTGRDGIHGATFSSGVMTNRTISVNSSAVQIGNAIEEKRMLDAILEARDKNLISAITDCGAAGFSSAIGELAESTGATVDISKCPLKYPGLSPWEIWMSESQERMALAVSPKKIKNFQSICKKYNVQSTVLGKFDGSHKLKIFFGKKIIANLDYAFLKHGYPQRTMLAKQKNPPTGAKTLKSPQNYKKLIKQILSHGNVCSKEPIVRLYDHSVQGTNALPPFSGVYNDSPNDAVIIAPILGKKYGVVQSHGMNPILNKIDPYWGSIWAFVESLSNYVAVGGDPKNVSIINNYSWPFPDKESMWDLDRSVDAVCDCMDVFKAPVISGKDSLASTFKGKDGKVIKIPPVLCISAFGKIKNVKNTVSADFKKINSSIYLVGKLDDHLGGSTYYDVNHLLGLEIPKVDLQNLPKLFNALYKSINSGDILACHDISEGGVISCLAEMCFGGDCGVNTKIINKMRPDHFLFNETAGNFIVEVKDEKAFKKIFKDLPIKKIGKTIKDKNINFTYNFKKLFSVSVIDLKKAWQKPLQKFV